MQLDEHFQRRLNEARMFFAEGKALAAEKIYRDLLKPDLPAGGRVLVLDGLGRCLHIQGRLEEAETFFRESLRFLEELFGPNHIHVAGGLQNLARLRSERGECEEAATLGERALDILKQNLPADDLRIADALLNLSSHQYTAKKYDAAEANLKMALHLWEAKEGRRCFGVSTCLNNLGRICEIMASALPSCTIRKPCPSVKKSWASIRKRPSRSATAARRWPGMRSGRKPPRRLRKRSPAMRASGFPTARRPLPAATT